MGGWPIPEAVRARLRAQPGYALARCVYGVVRHPQERGLALARLSGSRTIFQPFGTTGTDRYPRIFSLVRDRIGDGAGRRVLSFGCSTGDEVFSLRSWFPAASIKGLDVNPYNIRRCEARWRRDGGDPRLSFETGDSGLGQVPESYDVVFAMAVFRHGGLMKDKPFRCDPYIRFSDFEQGIEGLAHCLKPGGLLVIRHANFRFSDTAAAAGFEKIHAFHGGPISPIYGPDNTRLPGGQGDDGLFEKATVAASLVESAQPSAKARAGIGRRRRFLVEAGLALLAARLLTTIPFQVAVRWAGFHPKPHRPSDLCPTTGGPTTGGPAHPDATAIGTAVSCVARYAPFRAACLQQALAAAIMLRRRRLPVELHFSVARDGEKILAHARSLSDRTVVTGATGGDRFRPIAVFTLSGRQQSTG